MCRHLNFRNRSAMHASLDCDRLFTYFGIREKKMVKRGYISKIKANGVVVYIPSLGIEGMTILGEEYEYDDEMNCFRRGDKQLYGLYSEVKAEIRGNDEKSFLRKRFDIEIINE